eukprot:4909725-Amphidinium_carterae.1
MGTRSMFLFESRFATCHFDALESMSWCHLPFLSHVRSQTVSMKAEAEVVLPVRVQEAAQRAQAVVLCSTRRFESWFGYGLCVKSTLTSQNKEDDRNDFPA